MAAAVDLPRRLTAEAVGTALLLSTVVGTGIMGERLAGGSVAIDVPVDPRPSPRGLASRGSKR